MVAPTGQLELATRALTLDAVKGMLNELLTVEARQSLDEIGAVQHDLGSPAFAKGQSFSVVAARGGDDIWIEIRRHRAPDPVVVPVEAAPAAPEPIAALPEPEPIVEEPVVEVAEQPEPEPGYIAEPVAVLEPEPERLGTGNRNWH